MRRWFVIALLVGIALAPLLSARAAEPARILHVGIVNLNLPRSVPFNVAFEQRLRELGYVEGQNLAIDFLGLDGHIERLPESMEELVRRKVDVILAAGQEVMLKAAKQATGTIPIVMIAINYDPVALGYVGSLARPAGNITGDFLRQPELTGKRLELLKQTVPDIARAIVFWDAYGAAQVDAAATAAQSLQLPIKSVELRDPPYDYARALEAAPPRPGDALLFTTSIFFFRDRDRLAELALQHGLPSMSTQREITEAGGLISYGTNVPGMFRLAADYVDKIFNGAAPADLPVQQPTAFELVVNLKTAKALGLTIPQSILARADEAIE
jgi:putative tryptophan/tyrosine transport system substrate-binding protein